jgi:hypothetical protein
MIKNRLAGIAGIFVALSLLEPTYAATKFPDYPARKASECTVTSQSGGLVIGVQPIEDLKDQKTYFNFESTPKGFIPVYIVLENGSSVDSFIFDKTAIKLGQGGSSDFNPKTSMNAGKTALLDSGAFLMSYAGQIFAIIAFNNADAVRQNIMAKEVQSKTLSPGVFVQGFLYVPVPKKGPRGKIHLQIPVTRTSTGETLVLDVVF